MPSRRNGVALICLDVDGTLLGVSGVVSGAVWDTLDRARDAGIHLAMCSGRPGFGVTRELATRVDPNGWHCFQNGASVLHLGNGLSQSAPLDAAVVAMLVARARTTGHTLELYTDDDYVTESFTDIARQHAELLALPFVPRSYDTLEPPIVRAQWIVTHDELEGVLAAPHPGLEVSPSLGPALPDYVFVNLTRTGVDKGLAVRTIARAYDVSLEDVMYVGDGFNDTPALRIAGWPVVMRNAEEAALTLGRYVVGTVDEDGVVEAIEIAIRSRQAEERAAFLGLTHRIPPVR
ncbi:MAG: HAD hydrolase family protein [Gemmatimonadaceae bacterium]